MVVPMRHFRLPKDVQVGDDDQANQIAMVANGHKLEQLRQPSLANMGVSEV